LTQEERYAELVRAFVGDARVSAEGKGFGANALKVNGSIFAMLSSRGDFVVKLPRERVDELVAGGEGDRFDTGRGRVMKEWLAVAETSKLDWSDLAREALAYVGASKRKD
jgi:hypothetical protein